ncbi:MAG: cofactor-independent phosphoglycerate mutase [Spirochaetales bacterium]|nr:cofactor-independent phosphoglycerate mutase [Spirochaetales bacterium]
MQDKRVIIILDGAADYPIDSLNSRTPLEAAKTENLDRMVRHGVLGRVQNVPEGMPPGSDVAIMSLLGNDVAKYYTGRAPIEAVARGIKLSAEEWAFRCNLVTIENGVMKDYSAGGISDAEAAALMEAVNAEFGSDGIRFYPGVSYRNLMILKKETDVRTTPPHDISDKQVEPYYPSGKGSEFLVSLIRKSEKLFEEHPVNVKRRREGKNPATHIWLWGQGTTPRLPSFEQTYHARGAVITAVDLVKGIGLLMGFDYIAVDGATGFVDTNYSGKGEAAIRALKNHDLVCVHVEAPDESGHNGSVDDKIESIERIDAEIIGPVLDYLEKEAAGYRILALPDHPTPCSIKTHVGEPVLFCMAGSDVKPNGFGGFTEKNASGSDVFISPGYRLMEYFFK